MQTLKKLGMGPRKPAIPSELSLAKQAAKAHIERARREQPKYEPKLMDIPAPDPRSRKR